MACLQSATKAVLPPSSVYRSCTVSLLSYWYGFFGWAEHTAIHAWPLLAPKKTPNSSGQKISEHRVQNQRATSIFNIYTVAVKQRAQFTTVQCQHFLKLYAEKYQRFPQDPSQIHFSPCATHSPNWCEVHWMNNTVCSWATPKIL